MAESSAHEPGSTSRPLDEATAEEIRARFTEYVLRNTPERAIELAEGLEPRRLAEALLEAQRSAHEMDGQLRALRRSFVASAAIPDAGAEEAVIQRLDHALGNPPRQRFAPGSVLVRQDSPAPGIWIVLDGMVKLTRWVEGEEVVFHSKSVGRIVGLLAMAQRQQSFLSCTAVSDVTAIHVTWDQLDNALQNDSTLSFYFATVLTRSLLTRIRRSIELQLEVEKLNNALEKERDALASALHRLEQAQARLIESEKMATLGQLVAGVAHELNNPVTAIRRAADHVLEDCTALLKTAAANEALIGRVAAAMSTHPLSTSEQRSRREQLAQALGDEALARQLMRIGVSEAAEYAALLGGSRGEQRVQRLAQMERAYQLGLSLRNLRSGSERIAGIVKSLRSYSRVDREPLEEVDVHELLEDTLLLMGSRLRNVEVVREYGTLPKIQGHPAQLSQVWTNLIGNALDAMNDAGRLVVRTDLPDDRHVAVHIIDNGPGIAPEHRGRIFDLNFTTKHGGAAFGVGMGLLICRQIVTSHGGMIALDSEPGRTSADVVLPIHGPDFDAPTAPLERGTP